MSEIASLSSAQELRRELSALNQRFASTHGLPHAASYGDVPVIVYEPFEDRGAPRHGNFLPATYAAILANPDWRKRLAKPHSQARRALPSNGRRWMELDSSTSSDALLMNIFCYPRVFADGRLAALLGVDPDAAPEFGVKARVPLLGLKFDRTEIDMRLGSLLVEAKLTESDFQSKAATVVEAYRDFNEVFDTQLLPRVQVWQSLPPWADDPECNTSPSKPLVSAYAGYQLIRNVLAAAASNSSFCVLHDARRPDLREQWYGIMRCVRPAALRTRCQVLTWQELAQVLPPKLRAFLEEKYGI